MSTISTACKTCSTGGVPAGAAFCPTCGRRVGRSADRRGVAVGVIVTVGVVVAVIVAVGLWVAGSATTPSGPTITTMRPAARATPNPMPSPDSSSAAGTVVTPPPDVVPPTPAAIPVRLGDTDLATDPLSAYAGGPTADRLSVRGLRLGLAVGIIPPALLAESAPDHLRDTAGDLCAVDAGRVTEVHVRDPDLLARWPIDSTAALFARFGEPADTYTGDGNEAFPTFLYPDRGIHVRWDNAAGRIAELVLVRPGRR